MSVQEKLYGTAAALAARNPRVPQGAVAAESDTGVVKIGDGVTRYNSLPEAHNGTYATLAKAARQNLLRPVAWHSNHVGGSSFLAAAGKEHASYRVQHRLLNGYRAAQLRLLYQNFVGTTTGPQTLTIRAQVELQSKAFPVMFGGSKTLTLLPGGLALSDPIPLTVDWRENNYFYTTTYVDGGTGGRIPIGLLTNASNGEGNNLADATAGGADLTVSTYGATPTNPSAVSNAGAYSPTAILGIPEDVTKVAVCGMGDSIMIGTGDTGPSWSGGNTYAEFGFLARALCGSDGPVIGLIYNSRHGETAQTAADVAGRAIRGQLFDYCTHVVEPYGTNDVNASRTAAQIEADRVKLWRDAKLRGKYVWPCTTVPRSTSTDSWATVNNQTAHANDAARVSMNNWLRGGAPLDATTFAPVALGTTGAITMPGTPGGDSSHPAAGYFEMADAVESARDSGKWIAGGTADGIHPTAASHALMAGNIVVSRFV